MEESESLIIYRSGSLQKSRASENARPNSWLQFTRASKLSDSSELILQLLCRLTGQMEGMIGFSCHKSQ